VTTPLVVVPPFTAGELLMVLLGESLEVLILTRTVTVISLNILINASVVVRPTEKSATVIGMPQIQDRVP
jgi:hypothetical protein